MGLFSFISRVEAGGIQTSRSNSALIVYKYLFIK